MLQNLSNFGNVTDRRPLGRHGRSYTNGVWLYPVQISQRVV